jgi:hypothetical protein
MHGRLAKVASARERGRERSRAHAPQRGATGGERAGAVGARWGRRAARRTGQPGARPYLCCSGAQSTAMPSLLTTGSSPRCASSIARTWVRLLAYDRVISDCHFRKTGTEYDRKPGIKWLGCTGK